METLDLADLTTTVATLLHSFRKFSPEGVRHSLSIPRLLHLYYVHPSMTCPINGLSLYLFSNHVKIRASLLQVTVLPTWPMFSKNCHHTSFGFNQPLDVFAKPQFSTFDTCLSFCGTNQNCTFAFSKMRLLIPSLSKVVPLELVTSVKVIIDLNNVTSLNN